MQTGDKVFFPQHHILCQTHSRVTHCYILQEGEIAFFLYDELADERTPLFSTDKAGVIVGWEALHSPERFISSVSVSTEGAVFLKVSKEDLLAHLSTDVLQNICQQLHHLLGISLFRQIDLLKNGVKQRAVKLENYYIPQDSTLEERASLLRRSPFFGEFLEEEIAALGRLMERREYEANELIYDQDEYAGGIFVLIQGEVSLRRQEGDAYIDFRSISTPGYLFGWSSTFDDPDICRAYTEQKTSVYFVPTHVLNPLINETSFGISFLKMVIWLIGNHLQLSHSRYMHLLHDHNLISVKHLIDVNRPRIPLPSPLHQIPHLLRDHTTQALAFESLHKLHDHGTQQERHLSSICLDLLKGEEREMLFLESIGEVYKIVSQGEQKSPAENRRRCAEKTKEVFEHVSFHLEGMEHLPHEPGHIFIYNHLLNHPKYTLNNRFQLTLDSHFLSAFILYGKYGDPGMRIVRYGKSFEYGHQDYYENLGYINVYTNDSDLNSRESKEKAKQKFYSEANEYLKKRMNIIVSPEGTSFASEESPGPFKMGPFNLANNVENEPKIVPVIFCNFDKRIAENLFYCKILKPFKVSEELEEGQSLKAFVHVYRDAFALEVEKARMEAERLLYEHNK